MKTEVEQNCCWCRGQHAPESVARVRLSDAVDHPLGGEWHCRRDEVSDDGQDHGERQGAASPLWNQGETTPFGQQGAPSGLKIISRRGQQDDSAETRLELAPADSATPHGRIHQDGSTSGDAFQHHEVVALPEDDDRNIEHL